MVATHSVPSRVDCTFECLTDSRCVSYNYEAEDKPQHACELNEKKTTTPADLMSKPGYDYFDTGENVSSQEVIFSEDLRTKHFTTCSL